MTTSDSFWAYGSKLKLGDGATPEVFSDIAEIIEISGPSMERDSIEVTNQDSSDGYREFIPGFRDGGEVSFEGNWLPTNATHDENTGVLKTFNENSLYNWKLVLPDSIKTFSFSGFVTGFEPGLSVEEQGNWSITIKISGKPTPS